MAMLIDASVEQGMKAAERERQEEERMRQKETMHRIQEQAATTTKIKAAYQDELVVRKQLEEESIKQHRFHRQKQKRQKSIIRRRNDEMKREIFQEFEEGSESDTDDEDVSKAKSVNENIDNSLSKLKNWENSLEVEFDQLSNSIGKKWNNDRSDSILTLPLLDYIYDIFTNKLLVNEYSHRLPTSMLRKHVHRYVKCISLQIVLRQLQSKLKHHMQNLDKKKKNSQRLIATPNHMDSFLYLTDKQVDDSNEVDEYIEDLNFNKDFGVKHNDEKNEYHFMYESSDSDVDNLDELQKYALSTRSKEVELVINS